MFNRLFSLFVTVAILPAVLVVTSQTASAMEHRQVHRTALVLAMFGTTVEPALKGLLNIKDMLETRFPGTPVRIAFTSNIIRRIWQKRAKDKAYKTGHPEIPVEILYVKGPLATISDLQDQGFDTIVVQPTHIAPAEEYMDLCSYVKALASIKTIKKRFQPFHRLVMGRPALGTYGPRHPYTEDINVAVRAVRADVEHARKEKAALVYMGHGNEYFPSGGSYLEFESLMKKTYPDVQVIVGTVEGFPGFERVRQILKHTETKKVLLKPFMIVAGDHARNDMAGPGPDSWKSVLEKAGIKVITDIHGLGELDEFARIYVSHAEDAARDAGIELK